MLFHPAQLGLAHLDKATLEADKKACKKIGPCGVGKKALYLNSFYIDRRYYLPYGSISRVFKRVAMSQGDVYKRQSRSSATSRTSGMWMPCWKFWRKNSPTSRV